MTSRTDRVLHDLIVRSSCLLAVSVLLATTAPAQRAPTLTATRDLTIDGKKSGIEHDWGLHVSSTGTLALARAGGTSQVVLVAADGKTITVVGNSGDKPGEIGAFLWCGWAGDTLWVADVRKGKVDLFGPTGKFVRDFPIPMVLQGPPGTIPAMYSRAPLIHAVFPGGDLLLDGNQVLPRSMRLYPAIMRSSPSGSLQKLMGSYVYGTNTCKGDTTRTWCSRPGTTLSPNGQSMVNYDWDMSTGDSASYSVFSTNDQGDTVIKRHFRVANAPFTQHEADSLAADLNKVFPTTKPAVYTEQVSRRFPVHSPVRNVRAGDDGCVWLQLYSAEPGTHWLILDKRGEPVGQVTLPADIRITQVSLNSAWGFEDVDEKAGTVDVVRYRIRMP